MPNAAGNSVIAVSILVTALEAVGNSVRRIAARTAALGAQRKLIDVLVGFRFCPRPWKNAAYEFGAALCFAAFGAETPIR